MTTEVRKSKPTDETRAESARLKALYLAAHHGLSQAVFGERFQIGNQSAVTQFLNGVTPLSHKAAIGFAKGLGIEISAFSTRIAAEIAKGHDVVPVTQDDFVRVKRAGVTFSQGHGQVVYDEGEKAGLAFRREYLRKLGVSESAALVVDSKGRSNEPTIADGSVLLVNRAERAVREGKFFAFRLDGELFVKKLYSMRDGSIRAVSDNPDRESYPDMFVSPKTSDFELIGRVRWMASEL